MKKFKSHKTVEAGKIVEVKGPDMSLTGNLTEDSLLELVLEGGEVVEVPYEWCVRHTEVAPDGEIVGGYFVRYSDGYTSWSPAAPFEDGNVETMSEEKVNEFIAAEPMMKHFRYAHLPENLKEASKPFCELALHVVTTLPRNPERTVALRKLLEGKDCAVRALLD